LEETRVVALDLAEDRIGPLERSVQALVGDATVDEILSFHTAKNKGHPMRPEEIRPGQGARSLAEHDGCGKSALCGRGG